MTRRLSTFALCLGSACSDYEVQNLTVQDVFTQEEDPPADVLFVVDNSASMVEEQAILAANFGAFVELLGDTTADYRIGVTTTDAADAGILVGPVLTPDTPDVVSAFQDEVSVGTSGSRDEQGLAMAVFGVRPDVNPDFMRSEAVGHVVFVSDEDDHSANEAAEYAGSLRGAAPGESLTAHALVGDVPAGCLSGTSAANAGTRYLAVAEATGGLTESICADDYGPVLVVLGLAVAGWNPTFILSDIPAQDTLEVNVDGVIIPEREIDGWTYSIGDNAIVFSGRAIPRPGMKLVVSYQRGG
ncbi:hypothetical protein LBMAG42_46430 [Deltaproteobacteria bacterium]|nr:hypothetical protein LBMAG42_46430 [Deltaproteobacteria bacterium]